MGIVTDAIENAKKGYCYNNCKHLVKVGDTAFGCLDHDKLIIPEFPPYTFTNTCKDYVRGD